MILSAQRPLPSMLIFMPLSRILRTYLNAISTLQHDRHTTSTQGRIFLVKLLYGSFGCRFILQGAFLVVCAAASQSQQLALTFARRGFPINIQELATLRYSPNALAFFDSQSSSNSRLPRRRSRLSMRSSFFLHLCFASASAETFSKHLLCLFFPVLY